MDEHTLCGDGLTEQLSSPVLRMHVLDFLPAFIEASTAVVAIAVLNTVLEEPATWGGLITVRAPGPQPGRGQSRAIPTFIPSGIIAGSFTLEELL